MNNSKATLSRRSLLGVFAATAVSAAPHFANAAGVVRGAGDIRRIHMRSQRTGEVLNTIYWIEGEYIRPALEEISWFMRDWRENSTIDYAPNNVDIMAASHRLMETSEPYLLLSGYRSPATNAMLHSRSSAVASNSFHIRAMAADLRLSSRSISQMAQAAKACNSGGVGTYGRSNFVHMDCGPVRDWRG